MVDFLGADNDQSANGDYDGESKCESKRPSTNHQTEPSRIASWADEFEKVGADNSDNIDESHDLAKPISVKFRPDGTCRTPPLDSLAKSLVTGTDAFVKSLKKKGKYQF